MNSFERVRAAINFEETDRPPVIPETLAITATLANVSPRDYVRSGDLIAKLQGQAQREIGYDAVFAAADLCVEAEAIGCELEYPEGNYPHVKKTVIQHYEDLAKLSLPNPQVDGRMPEMLKAVRLLKKSFGGEVPVFAHTIGPMTLASRIMDIEKMLYMIVDHPNKFRDILMFCKEVSRTFAVALANEGADGIIMFDPSASPAVLPSKIFREFELDAVTYVFSEVKNKNAIAWYSVAGPVQSNNAILTETGADITTVDYVTPLETALESKGITVINGNIKPLLFLEGSADEVYAEARKLLAVSRTTERFILGSGCEIPLYSKIENIKALVRAAEDEKNTIDSTNRQAKNLHTITILPHRKSINAHTGDHLLDLLLEADVNITNYCNHTGSCGKCAVIIKQGKTLPPERTEAIQLKNRNGAKNERLACKVTVEGPMEIYVPHSSRVERDSLFVPDEMVKHSLEEEVAKYAFSNSITIEPVNEDFHCHEHNIDCAKSWIEKNLGEHKISPHLVAKLASIDINNEAVLNVIIDKTKPEILDFTRSGLLYGLAVDIGSTTISAYAHDLKSGELLCVGSVENPQRRFGMDIITRATQAVEDTAMIPEMQNALVEGINSIISHFHRENSFQNQRVYDLVLVGNPVIIHLFLGLSPASVSQSPFTPEISGRVSMPVKELGSRTKLAVNQNCQLEILPAISGFVGSDTVAGILATDLHKKEETSLFIDIGTNGELVINSNGKLVCASVAAGPALEGASLTHGRTCQNGVIYSIWIDDDKKVRYKTIGGMAPIGLCGSSVIDAIAEFVRHGIINDRGRFINQDKWRQIKDEHFIITPRQETAMHSPITISAKDIEEVQKAKSAIRTGVELLMKETDTSPEDIRHVYMSGSFGVSINMGNAKAIGMFPDMRNAKFTFIKNSAGIGGRMAILSINARDETEKIAKKASHINLVDSPEFSNLFIDNMFFQNA
ncbi:hypothetical protein MNBD_NITROSPINAE01-1206 [hydrothermal vent metagenome]|uniref:2Fe-2S ferredoxin-type domain-containing protein n=1 Tax=hydrothermal vent metagenome TaxID=652676 RepID=A0A3B1BXZ9_9ZZZZ